MSKKYESGLANAVRAHSAKGNGAIKQGFPLTEREAVLLVRYWARRIDNNQYFASEFAHRTTDDMYDDAAAWERIDAVAKTRLIRKKDLDEMLKDILSQSSAYNDYVKYRGDR